ncbi:exosome complex exonuclease RRP44-like [Cherax quadricarinatus]
MGILERRMKIFYRKTKKGNIMKIVREHYLRDDVWCGLAGCGICKAEQPVLEMVNSSNSTLVPLAHFILIDTNVALHQIDVLCDDSITNVIVPQTVIGEVKHRSLPIYKRLRDLVETSSKKFYVFTNEHHSECYVEREENESANDRNDRAIRVACWWSKKFRQQQKSISPMTLKINISVYEYVSSLENCPGLLDIVAKVEEEKDEDASHQNYLYTPHWSLEKIRAALKAGKLRQGVLKTSRTNFLEANVMIEGLEKTVLIQGRLNLNRALHDDTVAVQIFPEDQWSTHSTVVIDQEKQEEEKRGCSEDEDADETTLKEEQALLASGRGEGERQPTGCVVGIIRRKWRQYCGIIKKNEITDSLRHLFIPADKKIPFIRIETRQPEMLYDKRVIVAIDSWPRDSRNPKGHFVRVIGMVGDKEAENEVILLEHDCPYTKFSESVLNCLPKMPWVITPKDEAKREDLRHLDVCSVDPIGCTDIDDALHCRKLSNGNYEVGVHIADVSHFIRPNTALDKEAQNRSTTVYLTSRRIDMVPDLLSSNLCSLRGNVDRFAFSVIWEITKKAEVLSSRLVILFLYLFINYLLILKTSVYCNFIRDSSFYYISTFQASLRGKVSEFDSYVLFLHKNAIQVLVPTIGQQLTLYLDSRSNKDKDTKSQAQKSLQTMEVDEEKPAPEFEFNEQELYVKCGDVIIRPFDHLRIQVTVDASDVQHQRVVCKLITPVIPGFSVPPLEQEDEKREQKVKKMKKN